MIIAHSDETIIVEGNHYFPPDSVKKEDLKKSTQTSVCSWKGTPAYYAIFVDCETNKDAAWYCSQPSDKAIQIKDAIVFLQGVEISD